MKESDDLDKAMQELKKTLENWKPNDKISKKDINSIESLSLIGMAIFLIVPWFIAGLYIWGWLSICVALLVIGFETFSIIKYGKTISRIFWEFKSQHPRTACAVFGAATIGWVLLGVHLLA